MKKTIGVIITLSILLLSVSAYAADIWVCLVCGEENIGAYCEECGNPDGNWMCFDCHKVNTKKYCGNCGKEKYVEKILYDGSISTMEWIGWIKGENEKYEEAAAWYVKAIAHNSGYAMYALGKMYLDGRFGEPDYEKAKELYRNAVEAGYTQAQVALEAIW